MRSPFKWAGGKQSLASKILALAGPFDRYVEPFCGSASVFFSADIKQALLADTNSRLIQAYRGIAEDPYKVFVKTRQHCMRHMQHPQGYWAETRSSPRSEDPVLVAAWLLYVNHCGFNGLYRVNKNGDFNVPIGDRSWMPDLAELKLQGERLRCAELLDVSFEQLVSREGDFVYCDPPYFPTKQGSFVGYTSSGFVEDDHIRLKEWAERQARVARVVISNSDCAFVRELYKGHVLHEVLASRKVSASPDGRGIVKELLIEIVGPRW